MTGPSPAVQLHAVTKRFGDQLAVDAVTLTIAPGEFFSLLGPSGCGKTTTLRILAGFEAPDEGSVFLNEVEITARPAHRREIGMVFQNYALFPHLSVFENVSFPLRLRRIEPAEIRQRVSHALDMVRLPGLAGRMPAQLSGGQQQRVALARALVFRPSVVLLDEPLGALDLKLRKAMQLELKTLQREIGLTFVYVTHDQEEALTMSDRIAVMDRGRVEQVDDPEQVYDRPTTTFVAGFIGVSNLMPATVKSDHQVDLDQGPSVDASVNGFSAGERAYAVVRPEKLLITVPEESAPDGLPSVEGTVESSLYLGTATQITVDLGEDVGMTVLVPNADEEQRQRLPGGGARVRLSWNPEHMHLVKESAERGGDVEGNGAG